MKQQYVLHPGFIASASEGRTYFISASTLAYLYGVALHECRIAAPSSIRPESSTGTADIHLYPGWGEQTADTLEARAFLAEKRSLCEQKEEE